jgi:hypothetical protein
MAPLGRERHKSARSPGHPDEAFALETHMLDLLMLALVAASFALLVLYLTACERR